MAGNNQTIAGGGFHHVALNVTDFEKSIAFYCDGLGCVVRRSWQGQKGRAAMLDTGDGNYLELFEALEEERGSGSFIHVALRTDDCNTAHSVALQAGGREKVAPKDIVIPSDPPLPARISFVYGPDGEEVEFFQERVVG